MPIWAGPTFLPLLEEVVDGEVDRVLHLSVHPKIDSVKTTIQDWIAGGKDTRIIFKPVTLDHGGAGPYDGVTGHGMHKKRMLDIPQIPEKELHKYLS